MLSHDLPRRVASLDRRVWSACAGDRGHGPLRVQLHVAPRYQGAGVDSGALPRGARPRRFRGPLLLSNVRPAGARCRGECAAQGDREPRGALPALFGRTGGFFRGALRHERDAQDRRRGESDPLREPQDPRGDRRGGRLCGPRPQISDLGTGPLPRAARGGRREGARAQEAARFPEGGGRSARSAGMTTGRGTGDGVAGGPARHIPVLGPQAIGCLNVRPDGIYVDGTFGAGGHTRALLATPGAQVIGIDRDRDAIAGGFDLVEQSDGRLTLVEDRFSRLDETARELGHASVDGVLLDLGVSSMQLDEAARGFSFRRDGPLDMRMGSEGPSAADVVARASVQDLATIIATLGEERHARAVARAIVAAREAEPIRTTGALADIVARVVRGPRDIHPATRTFQALRMFVNDELAELSAALAAAERMLAPGGRLVVIAFHSLEDRVVKTFLAARARPSRGSRHRPEVAAAAPSFRLLTPRPVTPDAAETAANPRARSAKLRGAERTDAASLDQMPPLPRLPSLADVMRRGQ